MAAKKVNDYEIPVLKELWPCCWKSLEEVYIEIFDKKFESFIILFLLFEQ